MNKGKIIMLATAFVSALCVVWAINVSLYALAIALIANALFSLYVFKYKLDDKE